MHCIIMKYIQNLLLSDREEVEKLTLYCSVTLAGLQNNDGR